MARQSGRDDQRQPGQKTGTGQWAGAKPGFQGQHGPVFKDITWLQRWPRLIATCFTLLILVEILIFLWVAEHIGLALTLLCLIGSAVIGLWLIRKTGLDMVGKLRLSLAQGQEPGHSLVDGACFVIAGLLFILPGFFSDLIAVCLITPLTRNWLIRYFAHKISGVAGDGLKTATVIHDVDFQVVDEPLATATVTGDPLDQPFRSATPAETETGRSDKAPATDLGEEPSEKAASMEVPSAATTGEIISPPPRPAPSIDEDVPAETPAVADDEAWGSRARKRPIIDVEEN